MLLHACVQYAGSRFYWQEATESFIISAVQVVRWFFIRINNKLTTYIQEHLFRFITSIFFNCSLEATEESKYMFYVSITCCFRNNRHHVSLRSIKCWASQTYETKSLKNAVNSTICNIAWCTTFWCVHWTDHSKKKKHHYSL